MSVEDRMVEDQDFYVRVQKLKLAVTLWALLIAYLAGAFK